MFDSRVLEVVTERCSVKYVLLKLFHKNTYERVQLQFQKMKDELLSSVFKDFIKTFSNFL